MNVQETDVPMVEAMADARSRDETRPDPHSTTTCAIVGGGPAGAMLGLMLARKGVDVLVLEKHGDFLRDFRGNTLHPATMEIMDEMGLADGLLRVQHTRAPQFQFLTPEGVVTMANFGELKTRFPYIAFMAQWDFLDFVTAEAGRHPNFRLEMNAEVKEIIEEDGAVRGVRYEAPDGAHEVRATLTVAADGRNSRVRELSGLEVTDTGAPVDVLWFRLSRREEDPGYGGFIGNGKFLIMVNHGDYWQLGYVIAKGDDGRIRAAGLEAFRRSLVDAVPEFADRTEDEISDWDQVKLLSIQVNRLKRWYKPGLLFIGDAAHAMSPAGGVGINFAIQDAVAAANALTGPLQGGEPEVRHLRAVQRRRELPTRIIQRLQTIAQRRVGVRALDAGGLPSPPAFLKPLLRLRAVRTLPARVIAFGIWPVHLKR